MPIKTPEVKDKQSSDTAPPESISTPASIPVVQEGSGEGIAAHLADQESGRKSSATPDTTEKAELPEHIEEEKTDETNFAEIFKKCSYISDIVQTFIDLKYDGWMAADISNPLGKFATLWKEICTNGGKADAIEEKLEECAAQLKLALEGMQHKIKGTQLMKESSFESILKQYKPFYEKLKSFYRFMTSSDINLDDIDDEDKANDDTDYTSVRILSIDDLNEIISFSSKLEQCLDSLAKSIESTKADIDKIFSTPAPTSKEATANEEIIEQMQEKDWLYGDKAPFDLPTVCSVNGFTELQEYFTKIINSISAMSVQAKKDQAKSLLKLDIDEIDKKKVTSAQLKMLTKQVSNALNELNRYQDDSVNNIAELVSDLPNTTNPYDLQKIQKFVDAVEDAVRDALYALVNSDVFSEIPEDLIEPLKSMTGYLHTPENEQKWELLNPNRIWLWIQKQNFEKASEYDKGAVYRKEIEQMLSSYANSERASRLLQDHNYIELVQLKGRLSDNLGDADFVEHLMSDRFGEGSLLSSEHKIEPQNKSEKLQRFNVTDTTCISRICGAIALGFSNKNIPAEIKSEFKAFHLNETSSPFYKDLSEVTSPTFNGLPTNLYSKLIAFTKILNKLLPDEKAQEAKDEKDKPIITESAKINAARELISIITDFANRGELTNSYQLSKAVSALAPSFGFKLEKFKAKKEEYDFATRIDIIS